MSNQTTETFPLQGDSTQRSSAKELAAQCELFRYDQMLPVLMDSVAVMVLILNSRREVVFANRAALSTLNRDLPSLLGKRPGELLDCAHASTLPGGCGTGEACTMCGAARAIRAAQGALESTEEYRVRQRKDNAALDLRVTATPMETGGERFTVISLVDVSHENRRQALERIFFHDLLNTVGALTGYVELLAEASAPDDRRELTDSIARLTESLGEEIRSQRDLSAAESNDLAVRRETLNAREVLEELAVNFRNHVVSDCRRITIGDPCEHANLKTDRRLLKRVLGNMLKNALEATPAGGEVTLRCERIENTIRFTVHNAGEIPQSVQLQIFNRSYSTKGNGRGLGTYSMKLLGEKYLGGRISFTSTKEEGTTFEASFPSA